MREAYAKWPQLVLYDGTYGMSNLGLPLHILAVEDADGETRIIGMGFVASEDATTLEGFIRAFKNDNSGTTEKTKCFMTDKDMSERKVIKELFPGVELYLCIFHVLAAMKKKYIP